MKYEIRLIPSNGYDSIITVVGKLPQKDETLHFPGKTVTIRHTEVFSAPQGSPLAGVVLAWIEPTSVIDQPQHCLYDLRVTLIGTRFGPIPMKIGMATELPPLGEIVKVRDVEAIVVHMETFPAEVNDAFDRVALMFALPKDGIVDKDNPVTTTLN